MSTVPNPEDSEIRKIIEECKAKTKIGYPPGGGFFKPRLKGINHLEVGRSKIISNPLTIAIEWCLTKWCQFRNWFDRFCRRIFPRHPEIVGKRKDSRLVGRTIFGGDRGHGAPIHNLHLEFWGRTWLGTWRKLSAGLSDENGEFALPFDLRAARRLSIRGLRLEVQSTTRVYFKESEPHFHYDIFISQKIKKSDLIGLDYNLRTLPLDYWLYRGDCLTPRAHIVNIEEEAPEHFSSGRRDAFLAQAIPIELTKIKHLDQIESGDTSLTIEEIQSDYPKNLTTCIEKHLPGYTRGDDWFGERMMNGMNRGHFQPDPSRPGHYWIKYFGKAWYASNTVYALPTVEILFTLNNNGLPKPEEIHLIGELSSHDRDPFKKHVFTPADEPRWTYAKRVARVGGAFCTEVEEHFAGTHLNTEQYAIAAYRNLRLNPVAALLLPHLKEVSLIDHSADKLLIGGYIPSATALTEKGLLQRTRDILGLQDWKSWKPMEPISEAHTCANAENLFWKVVSEYVDSFFENRENLIKEQWLEIKRFSDDLVANSVPVFLSAPEDAPPDTPNDQALAKARLEYYSGQYSFDSSLPRTQVNGATRTVSPITTALSFEKAAPEDWENLKHACKYIIMVATYLHTWINEHQYDDLGEIRYSSGGLRYGEKPEGILLPESEDSIAPDLTRSSQMLWFTNLLSRTEYGFITRNEEGDVNPHFARLLEEHREKFKSYGVDIDAIESRTNI